VDKASNIALNKERKNYRMGQKTGGKKKVCVKDKTRDIEPGTSFFKKRGETNRGMGREARRMNKRGDSPCTDFGMGKMENLGQKTT